MNWPSHGSNPKYLYEALNIPMPDMKIDFSANINPFGPPPILKENWATLFNVISDYPDPHGYRLKKLLAEKEGLNESQILIGNGGAELIALVGRILAKKRVVIVQPAFSEYEEACRVNDCKIKYHLLEPPSWELDVNELSLKLDDADALFLCNPSNPTGVYYSKAIVLNVLTKCQENDCLLILDEAFFDFVTDYESIVEHIKASRHLIVIRSMTKMFAIPGLRLGYLAADSALISKAAAYQPHWSVNALALKAGEWCLKSEEYRIETIKYTEIERAKLFTFYKKHGYKVSPSRTNFYLLRDPSLENQLPLLEFLTLKGLIPRHTMNFPGLEGEWLRFAIKSSNDNDKLLEAFEKWQTHRL